MEGILRAPSMGGGIAERTNDLQEFYDRAGPAVGHEQRQGVLMRRAYVHEVNVEPVDLGHKLRQGIQLRLHLAPVVVRPPVAYELLDLGQPHALGLIGDRLPVGPPRRRDPSAEVDEALFRNVDAEGADCEIGHGALLSVARASLRQRSQHTPIWEICMYC
jgi:hypothetical protein